MDIAAASIVMSQASLIQKFSLAVTKMSLDNANQNSQNLIEMMELSINTNLGKNIDIRI